MTKLLTVSEVAELTRLSKATIYSYISAKKLPFIKIGARCLFNESEIWQWINDRRVDPINTEFSNV